MIFLAYIYIYRGGVSVEDEDKIHHKMISTIPDEFIDCHSVFDHLVKMQHYGLPTRLLDITKNPLVVLYFACWGEENRDGKINRN